MRYKSFSVKNYKGIDSLDLNLDRDPAIGIFTLVGLNESGKTTILEAINHFQNPVEDHNELVPKSKKANFTDTIQLQGTILFEDEDKRRITEFARSKNFELLELSDEATISKNFKFEATNFSGEASTWVIGLRGKTIPSPPQPAAEGQPAEAQAEPVEGRLHDVNEAAWNEVTTFIRESIFPKIVYYPDFLFAFPREINLTPTANEGEEQKFYRQVLQDVLDSLDQGLTLQSHLIDRKQTNTPNDIQNIEKVLNMMADKITNLVFTAWANISGVTPHNISVTLGNDIKQDSEGRLYIEVKVKEGTDSFYVDERSLGFRWFFTFLLFTQFRTYRRDEAKNTLFLLDEPASNLHQSGQQELLKSLAPLTKGAMVIYSTHSHHLINPAWLAGAVIISNRGLNPEDDALIDGYTVSKTDITAEPYYSYVAHSPNEDTHFKPILDVLDYKPSQLEHIPSIVVTEGKFDFFTIRYMQDVVNETPEADSIHAYPGAGASKHGHIISLYLAWGRDFVVLLDADSAGKRAKTAYEKDYGAAVKGKIFTLADIDIAFDGMTTEDLYEESDKLALQQSKYSQSTTYEKRLFNLALQELYLNKQKFTFSQPSQDRLNKVIDFLANQLI